MSKNRLVSEYKNNLIAKKSKIIYATLMDYFIVLIITFLVHVCLFSPINICLPSTKENISKMYESRDNLNQIVATTKIQEYDKESKSLVNISTSCKKYITSLVKTSYFIYDLEYPVFNEDPIKIDISATLFNKDNDNLTYFFIDFKSNNQDLNDYKVDGVDYSSSKEDYLYFKMLNYSSDMISSYFIEEDSYSNLNQDEYLKLNSSYQKLSRYQILNKKTCVNLMNYIERDDDNITSIYEEFATCYYQACSNGVSQIEASYSPYIKEYNSNFIKYYEGYLSSLLVCNILSYTLGFVIFEVVIYLLNKKKETIGNIVIKLAVISKDELELSSFQKFGLIISRFIMYFSSNLLCLIFANQLAAATYLFNGVSFLQFVVFSAGLDIISLIFLWINKSNLLISNLITKTVFKSKEEFEPIKVQVKEEKEDGKRD